MENNLKKYTIVYLTTNLINKKIYIGVHDTLDPWKWDGYFGGGINMYRSGTIKHPSTPFQYAVKKHGYKNFLRTTLAIFDKREDALELEKILVDEKFIAREDTYNITVGGGNPPKFEIPVYQYDVNGNFINSYPNEYLAATSLGGRDASSIIIAINNHCCAFESFWTKEFVERLDIETYKNTIQRINIYVYDSKGNYLETYPSIAKFAKSVNVTLGVVQRALKMQNKVANKYVSTVKVDKFVKKKVKKHCKPIYQYSLDGEFIKEFKSCLEASRVLNDTVYKRISTQIRINNGLCGDYLWSWEKVDKLPSANIRTVSRKVAQYDSDGNLIKVFETVRECRKEFGNVSRVLAGKATHCKGYIFKYYDN